MVQKLAAVLVVVLVYGVLVSNTQGRVNRKTHILSLLLYFFAFLCIIWLSSRIPFLFFAVIVVYPYVVYKAIQLNIRRLHDINHSGWELAIPFVSLYYILLMFIKEGDKKINQYDVSIDYTRVLRRLNLFPEIGIVKIDSNRYFINDQEVELLHRDAGDYIKCSKTELDNNTHLKNYFVSNFSLVEFKELNSQYYHYFKLTEHGMNKIIKDLNAFIVENNRLKVNGVMVYIRDEDFKYGLLYSKEDVLPLIKENYIRRTNPYYNHYILSKKQIADFFKDCRLTTAST